MTDDRSLERAARSWLEEGPSQAPDRAVDAALARILTTPQQRDLFPWRYRSMFSPARLAAAAVIVLAIGGGVWLALQRPQAPAVGTPSPAPSVLATSATTAPETLGAFQDSRTAACNRLRSTLAANSDLVGLYDPNAVGDRRTTLNARQRVIATAVATLADDLAAIDAPPGIATAHAMDVARQQDLAALFQVQSELLESGKILEAGSLEQSFEALGTLRVAFEQGNGLRPCS